MSEDGNDQGRLNHRHRHGDKDRSERLANLVRNRIDMADGRKDDREKQDCGNLKVSNMADLTVSITTTPS